jgi:PIN domain nuclease of toxin-antitoxin system
LRILLDTHVVLWQLAGSRAIGVRAQAEIEGASELLFSVVSLAEIGVKVAMGKLTVPDDLHDYLIQSGLHILPLAPDHGLAVAELPMHHRDPFDRLLIAQARGEGLAIMTADRRLVDYDVVVVDAGL